MGGAEPMSAMSGAIANFEAGLRSATTRRIASPPTPRTTSRSTASLFLVSFFSARSLDHFTVDSEMSNVSHSILYDGFDKNEQTLSS